MKPEQTFKIAMPPQVNNIRLGIPVRLIRKNKDKGSEFGSVYIYDGLYDVVRPSVGIYPIKETFLPTTQPCLRLNTCEAVCSMSIGQANWPGPSTSMTSSGMRRCFLLPCFCAKEGCPPCKSNLADWPDDIASMQASPVPMPTL